ncbi:hypothetical protein P8452_50985 [Trifolium repens]|nr:hypothetical protein P8452_50985 [Trifolium repens]
MAKTMKTRASLALLLITALALFTVTDSKENNIDELPCVEFYIVDEGETLESIGKKCNDPYILFWNPLIHDAKDIAPGVILRIIPNMVSELDLFDF